MLEKGHERYMNLALKEAEKSLPEDVPVGAVVVKDGKVVGRGHNQREKKKDPTLHAEIIALRQAAKRLGAWYLSDCLLYVTLEPCPMCTGALILARIKAVVFGAFDPKGGALGSVVNLNEPGLFNHYFEQVGGIEEERCAKLLKEFFKLRRGG